MPCGFKPVQLNNNFAQAVPLGQTSSSQQQFIASFQPQSFPQNRVVRESNAKVNYCPSAISCNTPHVTKQNPLPMEHIKSIPDSELNYLRNSTRMNKDSYSQNITMECSNISPVSLMQAPQSQNFQISGPQNTHNIGFQTKHSHFFVQRPTVPPNQSFQPPQQAVSKISLNQPCVMPIKQNGNVFHSVPINQPSQQFFDVNSSRGNFTPTVCF